MLRQPIISLLGHVDHGKTTLLDKIRKTAVVKKEAGLITQHVSASEVSLSSIKEICGSLLNLIKTKITIPGLLFLDTPGHSAFTNLRKRGGSLADIAVLVVDINEGIMPQTKEAIEILKHNKTPFIVAANKIDLINGFSLNKEKTVIENINDQEEDVRYLFDEKLYTLVASLSELGINSERFDKVEDYTKQVAIVPTAAKRSFGIAELLLVLTGLSQKYLEQSLKINVKGYAKATVLEVKEERGLGKILEVILYDGILKKGDLIVIGDTEKPIQTKVKAILKAKDNSLKQIEQASAAANIKIVAQNIEEAKSGMPLGSCSLENLEQAKKDVQKEIETVLIKTSKSGITVKADTLGSLEALNFLLKEKDFQIRKASIGDITKKDVSEASATYNKDPLNTVVLGFNVKASKEILEFSKKNKVKIFTDKVIYLLIERFVEWHNKIKNDIKVLELEYITKPFKIRVIPGYVFRQSKPAIVGIEVLEGTLTTNKELINEKGEIVGKIKSIQVEKERVSKLEKNKRAAISIENATIGRNIKENDILYNNIKEDEFRKLKGLSKYLKAEEIELLKKTAEIKREDNALWGI